MAASRKQRDTAPGTGVPIRVFREDASNLSPEDFEECHGSAFLLLTAAELTPPKGPCTTEVKVAGVEESGSERTASLAVLAFPVRRTEHSVVHLVTVGRTSNNDMVVPDVSVSRFHAYLKQGEEGVFQVQDANSTNGTTVNGTSVPSQGQGPAAALKSGDTLRFGQVEFTFLSAEALREFALKFSA
jgi:hypothetical protein